MVSCKTTTIPVVISAVTDPATSGLAKTNEKPGGNITGVSDLTPVEKQINLLKEILPSAKKIAIMYCSAEDNSIFQGNIALEAAKQRNLNAKVYKVSDSNDIQAVAAQIVSDQVDVVYIPTDNLLATYMRYFWVKKFKKKITLSIHLIIW